MLFVFQYRIEWSKDPLFSVQSTSFMTTSSTKAVLSGMTADVGYYVRVAVQPPTFDGVVLPSGLSMPYVWSVAPGCDSHVYGLTGHCSTAPTAYVTKLPVVGMRCFIDAGLSLLIHNVVLLYCYR